MLSNEEMIELHTKKHGLIDTHNFQSKEEYVLHLIHTFAYVQASRLSVKKSLIYAVIQVIRIFDRLPFFHLFWCRSIFFRVIKNF